MKRSTHYILLFLCLATAPAYAQVNFNLRNGLIFTVQNGCAVTLQGNLDIDNSSKMRNEGATLTISGTTLLNGTVEYAATGNQTIMNAAHGTLAVSGSGNKSLPANLDVNTGITLGGTAKIITGTNILTLKGTSGSISGGTFGSAGSSWIVTGTGSGGPANTGLGGLRIENIGGAGRSGAVLFPLGPTTTAYNPARLTNTGTQDNFLLAISDQAPPGCTGGSCVNRTWNFSEAAAGGTTAAIDLQFNSGEQGAGVNLNNVSVAHYIATGPDMQGATQDISAQSSPYTVSGSGFNAFSPYGINSGQALVPIKLLSFTGTLSANKTASVSWRVEEQSGVLNYSIEKSMDGISFITVGNIAPNGFFASDYHFTDPQLLKSIAYYRLKITEHTHVSYSAVIRLGFKNDRDITAYPAPAHSVVVLQSPDQSLINSRFNILDARGLLMRRETITTLPQQINIESLPAGIYILQFANGRILKIIKQ